MEIVGLMVYVRRSVRFRQLACLASWVWWTLGDTPVLDMMDSIDEYGSQQLKESECMKGPEVSYMLDPIDESSVQRFDEYGIQQ